MKLAKKDIRHLDWIYERMKYAHNENTNLDYMIAFRRIIDGLYKEYADYHKPQTDLPAPNTVMWWLCRIADPEIRRRAVSNCLEWGLMQNERCPNIGESIGAGFMWGRTKEGVGYWDRFSLSEIPLLSEPDFTEYNELKKK